MASRAARAGRRLAARGLPVLPLAWLVLLFVVPLGFTLVYAFAESSFARVELGFTTENFKEAMSGFYLDVFWRTVRFALLGTLLVLVVALPVSYFVARKAGRLKMALLVLLLIPFWTSFLVRILSWRTLLDQNGPIEDALNFLHLHSGNLEVLDTPTAVFIGIVYGYLPFAVIPLFVAFERISPAIIEASKDLGAGRWKTFAFVTLPMARAGFVTATLLVFVPMTGEFIVPELLGGAKGAFYGNMIETAYLRSADYPLGAAMAISLLVVIGIAVLIFAKLTKGFQEVPR
jgi:spermidine/putrescine transport system permease protein